VCQSHRPHFEARNLTGKKLALLDMTDLKEILHDSNLSHQLTIYRSLQNLLQMKHDLNKETLQSLIFCVKKRIVSVLNYLQRLNSCNCNCNSTNDPGPEIGNLVIGL
jgi:hypothetical protein